MSKSEISIKPDEFNELKAYLEENNVDYLLTEFPCSIKLETKSSIFNVSLTGEEDVILNMGNIANAFYTKCKVHYLKDQYGYTETYDHLGKKHITWEVKTAAGYHYENEYYKLKKLKCWSYDINSAFPYAMLKPMPDTRKEPRFNDIIKKGEIGFLKPNGGVVLKENEYADIIFPLMESPFKDYVVEHYMKKKELEGVPREIEKSLLNFVTGLVQRRNIFLRNAIIYYSNEYIKSFIDDNTVYCNVDCIVSLVPRYDIPIGQEIGQFKEEHNYEDFKYGAKGVYQWGNECHYSGIPKGAITDIEHIDDWTKNLKYIYINGKVILNEKKINIQ